MPGNVSPIDVLIHKFETYATQAITPSTSQAQIRSIVSKLNFIIHSTLPRMHATAVRLELQDFFESLHWNVRRLLHEPGESGAFSSIRANMRGVIRMRGPRSARLQAELQSRWGGICI